MDRREWLAGMSLAALARPALAAEWPERLITIVLPFTAGGPSDGFARMLARQLHAALGGPGVVVLNRPGAAGNIGMAEVANAQPDGTVIGIATNSVAAHVAMTARPIVTLDSLTWIANLVYEPSALVVRPERFANLAAFLAAARQGPISVGHAGIGTSHQIALTMLERRAGIELVQVAFPGSSQAKTQLIGGHIDAANFPLSEVLTMVREGQGTALAVTTAVRSPFAPDLPTFTEQGVPLVSGTRRAMVAPPGLPQPLQQRLATALEGVMRAPEVVQLLNGMQIQVDWMPGPAMLDLLRQELAALRALGLSANR